MEIPIFTVDAFTNLPFKGNPAAICLIENELRDDLYQSIAAEMNLSETAFITRRNSMDFSSGILLLRCMLKYSNNSDLHVCFWFLYFLKGARFGLRWFTPTSEIPLCGHATLASAAVLFYLKKNVNPVLVFETMSGELCVRQHEESLIMDFPLNKPNPQDQHEIKDLLKVAVGDVPIQEVCYSPTTRKLMIRLADTCSRSELTSLKPEAEALLKNESTGKIKGVIVTMKGAPTAQPGYDFYSRYFAPWVGILEDPVCGSAHTVLAAYWSEKLNKKKMLAYQCSSRGGELGLEVRDDGRLNISGQAQIVLQGTLKI
uniref:Phenazine biosynthesis-like protein domain containing 2 n=1 Tax=Cyprinus carpio carpio TaxID=630221 RepID=A0A9J7X8G2_CYPCA